MPGPMTRGGAGFLLAVAAAAAPCRAQPAPSAPETPARDDRPAGLRFWPESQRDAYARHEAALLALPTRDSLLAAHQWLADEPHLAGTEADRRTAMEIADTFRALGLEVEVHEFWAYLPWPVRASAAVVTPEAVPLSLKEAVLPEDPNTGHDGLTLGWNAYSGSGDVTAEVVYANYGTKEDFRRLAELSVSCAGKIVVARYGGNYRGYKARFAEEAGAAGLIIYTDPADAGYSKGLMYPEGGWASDTCVQRGSIVTLPYSGDPLTPGVEATRDATRLDPASVDLPGIPVQPMSWQAAGEILSRMTGAGVPEGWQGALPFAYRVTGGPGLTVRLQVEQSRELRASWNVIGTLRGAGAPPEGLGDRVIIGAHHDAWGFGAADPTCGTIAVIESARAFSAEARAGRPPRRTIQFCAWGAEEFGIIGSVEWVESRPAELARHAVAYINLDMASMGPDFSPAASPSLRPVIEDAARVVPAARRPGSTVFDAWTTTEGGASRRPTFGEMGGGSDHVGFVCHVGVPSCGLGGSGARGNSYHTAYDTLPWYWKAVGDDYEPALLVSRMTTAVAARLANAPVVPLSPARTLAEAAGHIRAIGSRAAAAGLVGSGPGAGEGFDHAASRAEGLSWRATAAVDALLDNVGAGGVGDPALALANELLLAMDRVWIDDQGLPGRPWFRSLYAATDEDSGYAAWVLPGPTRAVERGDAGALLAAIDRVSMALDRCEGLIARLEAVAAGE